MIRKTTTKGAAAPFSFAKYYYMITTNDFILRASEIHSCYDYSSTTYTGAHNKIIIICPIHGKFKQSPSNHLQGYGCKQCGLVASNKKRSKNIGRFIREATRIHGSTYDYSKVIYKNNQINIKIICDEHGTFTQQPRVHLRGAKCPQCNMKNRTSRAETKWLDSLSLPNLKRQHRIILNNKSYVIADGYDSETNTIYEFFGDFWHGNPDIFDPNEINTVIGKTFRELYESTCEKIKKYKNHGYTVISIWENDSGATR